MMWTCDPPEQLADRRAISFEEPWRYELALAELLDAIRRGADDIPPTATPASQSPAPTAAGNQEDEQPGQSTDPPAFILRVFISHSSADNAFGLDLERRLKDALAHPNAVFYDSDGGLIGGDEWLKWLQHEITARNVFVLLLSPQAFASPWVDQELSLALLQAVSAGGKVVIPVIHRETAVWPFLANFQFVDFAKASLDEAFTELLDAVRLGHSRRREVEAMRQERLGPTFDVDLLPMPERFVGRDADLDWALQRPIFSSFRAKTSLNMQEIVTPSG
jgi:hypothetical protein